MPECLVRPGDAGDIGFLVGLSDTALPGSWSAGFWRAQLGEPCCQVLIAEHAGEDAGLLLVRRVLDEAEIIAIAVTARFRRHGIGNCLLNHLEAVLRCDLPCRLFLEVSVENNAAIAFYAGRGFTEAGVRKGYYREVCRAAVDALVLSLDIVE